MPDTANRNQYARSVSLFLAELLRTRKISLNRASEIAQKVLENINLIDTEQQFLEFVKVLTSDFEELHHLGEVFHMNLKVSERKELEQKVRLFVIQIISSNMVLAGQILTDAIKEKISLKDLTDKFPEFKEFIQHLPHSNAGTIHESAEFMEQKLNV